MGGRFRPAEEPRRSLPAPVRAGEALADGKVSAGEASDRLRTLASEAASPADPFVLPGELLLKVSGYGMNGREAGEMALLIDAAFNTGDIGFPELEPALRNVVEKVAAPDFDGRIDPLALARVRKIAIGLGGADEAEIRGLYRHAAEFVDRDVFQWAAKAADALGGRAGLANTVAGLKAYLAFADSIADLLATGKLADLAADRIRAGEGVGKAVALASSLAELAMDNDGWREDSLVRVPELEQVDGVAADERSALALVQIVRALDGDDAKAARAWAIENRVEDYLTGLGSHAMLNGGQAIVENMADARQIIDRAGRVAVREAAGSFEPDPDVVAVDPTGGGFYTELLGVAQEAVGSRTDLFLDGLGTVADAAQFVFEATGDAAPLGFGSLGAVASFAFDPNADGLINLGVSLAEEILPIGNPLEKAGMIADVADVILDDLGVADALGPFVGGVLEGAVEVVQLVSGAIDGAIDAAVNIVVRPVVEFGVNTVISAGVNFANFVEGLATGDFEQVLRSVESFATDLVDGVVQFGESLVAAINEAVDLVVDILEEIVNIGLAIADAVVDAVSAIAEGLGSFIGAISSLF